MQSKAHFLSPPPALAPNFYRSITMLAQVSRSLTGRFDSTSYGTTIVRPAASRLVTAPQTPSIPVISCRFRIKRTKYPLQWVQQKLEEHKDKKNTLTLNQFLANTLRGTRIDRLHAPISKKVRIHALRESCDHQALSAFVGPTGAPFLFAIFNRAFRLNPPTPLRFCPLFNTCCRCRWHYASE